MKFFKLIIPFICIVSMVGFEAVRDMSYFYDLDSTDVTVLSTMSEEDQTEEHHNSNGNSLYELDVDLEELANSSFLRENVWLQVMKAHDLNFNLLEQKVIIPPPEFLFS